MSSLVYHSGTRGINFHTRQWFGVPKAFTALLFKPLLSHTITIPNSLAGNQPTVFTTLVSQSFISPVLLYMSLMLVNDVNFLVLKSPIMLLIVPGFYVTDRHYMHQDISSIKSDVNRISQRDWRQKKTTKKPTTPPYCFLPNNELSLLFTGHKTVMQKFVHLFYWNMSWLLSSWFKLIFHFQ